MQKGRAALSFFVSLKNIGKRLTDWVKETVGGFSYLGKVRLRKFMGLPKKLKAGERVVSFVALAAIGAAVFSLVWEGSFSKFTIEPVSFGSYTEAVVGRVQTINPIFVQTDADRDLVRLTFSALMKVDDKGEVVPDLAESVKTDPKGLWYEFKLRSNLKWSDGVELTANDVFYTYGLVKRGDYVGAYMQFLAGVEIKKVGQDTIRFELKKPFAPFMNTALLGILPAHIWSGKTLDEMASDTQNFQPVCSGPYKVAKTAAMNGVLSSIELVRNEYSGVQVYIPKITLRFFDDFESAFAAYKKKEVQGLAGIPAGQVQEVTGTGGKLFQLPLPQYTAAFFNLKNPNMAKPWLREALSLAVNKSQIIRQALGGLALEISSPVLPGYLGYTENVRKYAYNVDAARTVLEKNGCRLVDGKLLVGSKPLNIKITYPNSSLHEQIAQQVKTDWENLGISVELDAKDIVELQQVTIPEKGFDVLLFGENVGIDADPYPYWHSSQVANGFNISSLENVDIDKLLEEARTEIVSSKRAEYYSEFAQKVTKANPAIFLYQPYYGFVVDTKIKGVKLTRLYTGTDRFNQINDWYIKEKKVKIK